METRCVTQKDACNTSTCQAGEASRSRGSRIEWQQRTKQQANKTRRRRGLNVMNYFMCPVSECGILWRFHCGFCTFCISFASRSTLYIITGMSPGADPDLDVNSEFRRNSYGFSVKVGRGRGLLDGEPLGDDIGATTTLHAAPRPTPHAVAAGPTPHLVAGRGTHRSGLVAGLEACSFCGPRYPGRGHSD